MADPPGEMACLQDLSGRVEAIELGGGASRWRADAVGMPLLMTPHEVLVLELAADARRPAHGALLERSTGALRSRRQLAPLAGVASGADIVVAADAGERSLRVSWRSRGRYGGGAGPPESVLRRFTAESSGAVEWDLETDAVEVMPAPSTLAGEALPSWAYRQGGSWREVAWRCGESKAWLSVLPGPGSTSDTNPEVVLETVGPDGSRGTLTVAAHQAIEPQVTLSGGHLLVRRTSPPEARWRVIDVAARRELGTLPYLEGADQVAVIGGRMYFVAHEGDAWALESMEIPSGRIRWRHSLANPGSRPGRLRPY